MGNVLFIEEEIKVIYEEDKSNPMLYVKLKCLSEVILKTKSMAFYYEEIDEISHDLAADIFMDINNKDNPLQIKYFSKYISLKLFKYREKYLEYKSDFILEDVSDLYRIVDTFIFKDKYSFFELDDLMKSIPSKIKYIFDDYIRYKRGSEKYNCIWTSIVKTINYNKGFNIKVIKLFKLDKSYLPYIKFLVNIIKEELRVYLKELCGEDIKKQQVINRLASDIRRG